MPGLYSKIKTVVDGETITATDRNAEHDNHITNAIPTMIDDYSTDATEMQVTIDPYPSDSPSLATHLAGEIQRLRYLIKQITGEDQWYIDPDTDLAVHFAATAIHGATGAVVGTTNVQTLTDKTLTAPAISSPVVTGDMTYASATVVTNLNADTVDGLGAGAAVNGYVRGILTQIHSDSVDATSFDILANISTAWESVGKTGSGATNIWTALDSVPAAAKAVILRLVAQNPNASTYISFRVTGSATAVSDRTRELYTVAGGYEYIEISIPIDSSIRFDVYREGSATTGQIAVWLKGWIE